ncbi:MAG: hypothetical protein QOD07_320 [Frankiaceae bacterium]|nr:hypothetical protein [Frankiaceae bacterium]
MTSEEQALRNALSDVAVTGQPIAPPDRVDGVRRKYARRQQHRMVALGAAVVVAVVGVALGAVGLRVGHGTADRFAHRDLPKWALSWPEHRDRSIPDAYLATAYRSWRLDNPDAAVGPGAQVIWYLAERIPDGQLALAFEVGGADTVPTFVVGTTDAKSLGTYTTAHLSKDSSLWGSSWDAPGVYLTPASVIGMYAHAEGDLSGRNAVVLLTGPRARSAAVSYVDPTGHVTRTLLMTEGFAAVQLGPLRTRVHVDAIRAGDGHRLAGDLDVGVPGTDDDPARGSGSFTPDLMPIPPFPDAPTEPVGPGEMWGQENFSQAALVPGWPLHATLIYARCFGRSRSIAIHVDSDVRAQTVVIPCDDREHVVNGPGFLKTGTTEDTSNLYPGQKGIAQSVDVYSDGETSWRAVVVAR